VASGSDKKTRAFNRKERKVRKVRKGKTMGIAVLHPSYETTHESFRGSGKFFERDQWRVKHPRSAFFFAYLAPFAVKYSESVWI
jgi:hypothetical protein